MIRILCPPLHASPLSRGENTHQVADGFDHDAGSVAGQISQRHFFHVYDFDAVDTGAGIDSAVARFALA